MVVDFSKVDVREKPIIILKNATDTPIGVLGAASAVAADIKYNEVSTLEFNFPAYVDGEKSDKYDSVVGMKIVDLQNIGTPRKLVTASNNTKLVKDILLNTNLHLKR